MKKTSKSRKTSKLKYLDTPRLRIAAAVVLSIFLLFFCAVVCFGCAGIKAKFAAKPLVEIHPCLNSPVPDRAMIAMLAESEKITYPGEQGKEMVGVRLTVTPESMYNFFNYVESLEKIAKAAAGCVAR